MKMSFRWFGPQDDSIQLKQIRQIPGMGQIVGALPEIPVGEVWPEDEIAKLRSQVENQNMKLEVIESVNIHEDIKLGRPSRDRYIENYKKTIINLSKQGIKVICYNFMPIFDWVRTDLQRPLEDGSTAMSFSGELVNDSPENIVKKVTNDSHGYTLPGWEPERLSELESLFSAYSNVDEDDLRENLNYFLNEIIPVCEEVGIKMAIHPDDPPRSIFGLPRIVKDRNDLNTIVGMIDSPMNGITLCTGSLGENPQNNVPELIREFVSKDKVPFVHARNILFENNGDFRESPHLSNTGSLDMYEIINTLVECGYDGYIRPDHGRMIWGETGRPGYGLFDRALGSQYLYGLIEACEKKR